jgi:mRNA interferase MazF
MRPIHTARLDKVRPVLVLTRELVRPYMARVTVAPITTSIRDLSTEVPVGPSNGLDADSVISCDNIVTIPEALLGERIGYLLPEQEVSLTAAIHAAFDLDRS